MKTNATQAIADCHAFKPAAAGERILPDARHAVRDRYARKTATALERTAPNARHAVRYRHARKPTAAAERIRPDPRHVPYYTEPDHYGNRHGACWRRRDCGRIAIVENLRLRRFGVDFTHPSIARVGVGPWAAIIRAPGINHAQGQRNNCGNEQAYCFHLGTPFFTMSTHTYLLALCKRTLSNSLLIIFT